MQFTRQRKGMTYSPIVCSNITSKVPSYVKIFKSLDKKS